MNTVGRLLFMLLIAAISPACNHKHNNKPPPTLPAAPTGLLVTATSTCRIDLSWTDNSNNERGFRIDRSTDGGATFNLLIVAPEGATAYSDLGLLPNTTYTYRVAASNGVGLSAYAGPTGATTKPVIWKSTIGGPGVRANHSAIYDSVGHRMILFGGQDDSFTYHNDVWVLDLNPTTASMATPTNYWSPMTPAPTGGPPRVRFGHSAVYDAQNGRMVVFGGQTDLSPTTNEIWILTLGASPAWIPVSAPGGISPTARWGHSAVYDAANQRMVVFGGVNALTNELDDTLFLSLPADPAQFAWSQGPFGPIKRTEFGAVYDGLREQMVLFGGLDHDPVLDGSVLNGETWSLSLSGFPIWNQYTFSNTPMFRRGHSAVYDAANQRMVMFGGDTTYGPTQTATSELWSLRFDIPSLSWMFLNPSSGGAPAARYDHSAVYDSGKQRMIIYGGFDSSLFPAYPTPPSPPAGVIPDPYTWIIDF